MTGNNFRNEYKASMEDISPSSGLLKHICEQMKQAKSEPVFVPAKNKSFYARHRSILTAAATFAVVIGIFAVGAVVVTHLNDVKLSSSDNLSGAGNAASVVNEACEPNYSPAGNGSFADGNDMASPPGAFSSEIANNPLNGSEPSSSEEYYSDIMLRELAEKARNGTLTINDIGKNITIRENGSYCHVFCSFNRGGTSYTLSADFESIDGELRVVNLHINESEHKDDDLEFDLINDSDFLDDYFSGNLSGEIY